MAAEGRSCSARALAVQVWLPLALDTLILRCRSFFVASFREPAIVVRGATTYGPTLGAVGLTRAVTGTAVDPWKKTARGAAVRCEAGETGAASADRARITDNEPNDTGRAV